jgi:L-amino acid N-acyltransferase YncA
MNITIRPFEKSDIPALINIWNTIVESGNAFPQEDYLTEKTGFDFFSSQTLTAAAFINNEIAGMYILHPNNVGRCAHIANASYAVKSEYRGMGAGEALVTHSLEEAKKNGFRILQFNAVVASNLSALKLYKKLGFVQLGTIPGGFRMVNGEYADIIPHYIDLTFI